MYTTNNLTKELITKAQYDLLSPCDQGYVIYMQAEQKGSELKHSQANPYDEGSLNRAAWDRGQLKGVLEAQDSEE